MDKIFIFLVVSSFILTFALGYFSCDLYKTLNYERDLNGLNLRGYNYTQARQTAFSMDARGDWVCVNVLGMGFDECYNTASHECSHEIMARKCNNHTKCVEFMKEVEK